MQGEERVDATSLSEDPNPIKPTHRRKEEKEKTDKDKMRAAQTNREALTLHLKPAGPTPSSKLSPRSFHDDNE